MKDKFAVVILNYFRFDLCKHCISSVLEELQASIFLVDNSSNTEERIRIENEYKENSNVNLFFPENNLGFAGGVNLGLKSAVSCGYAKFFLLNNDAVLAKGSGPLIVNAVDCHPGSVLSPIILWGATKCAYHYYHNLFGLITRNKPKLENGWITYFTGCALIFDLTVLQKIGCLNPAFFMYGEDLEFCFRAEKNKVPLYTISEGLVHHEGSSSAQIASFFYEYHLNRSHFLLSLLLNDSNPFKILVLLLKTFPLSARALIRSFRHRTLSPIAGFLLSPINLPVRPKTSIFKKLSFGLDAEKKDSHCS